MTRWGVGPRFSLLSTPVVGAAALLHVYRGDDLSMGRHLAYAAVGAIGAVLLCIGILFYVIALIAINRALRADALATEGVYRACRHPLYAAWVVFILPGSALLLNSWLALCCALVLFGIMRILIRDEEVFLESKFGAAYLVYKRATPAILPLGWLRGRRSP